MLFHPGMAAQWPWHWGSWRENATVLLDGKLVTAGKLDPLAWLAAMPAAEVSAKRQAIARHAHALHYARTGVDAATLRSLLPPGAPPGGGDAFDLALRGAWARARRANTSAVRAAQEAAAAADAAAAEFAQEASVGYCEMTTQPGNCNRTRQGYWTLGDGLQSMGECAARCRRCRNCRYVSFSLQHAECGWFARCSTAALVTAVGGETYRTRRVKR